MGNDNLMVTICLERYEELLDIETRTDILRDYLNMNEFPNSAEVLRILGYIEDAERITKRYCTIKEEENANKAEINTFK